MLSHPKKASFYSSTTTYDDSGAEVKTNTLSFNTGVRLVTLSFKEQVRATGTVDTTKFHCYTRKNTNTLTVAAGDYVSVDGVSYQVMGVDPMHQNRAEIMFLFDMVDETIV